jgi:conjugative transfer pilus assembly protein TraH
MKTVRFLLVVVIILNASANPCFAGWIDDWMQQKSISGPNHFDTQKRGFTSFGNFSARWQTGNDYLVAINKPQFKAGCGGIDLFLGGMDLMQFDYLVNKLQRTMGAASAAFAFDIAMSVLSEKVANSMKSIMAIVDRVNQLQFDDCKAGQAIAATLVDAANPKVEAKDKTQAMTEFAQQSGVSSLWHELKNFGAESSVQDTAAASGVGNMAQLVSGCPLTLREIFFTQGYVLSHLGSKRGYQPAYIDLVRGLIGDIKISPDGMSSTRIDRCPQNTPATILDTIADGNLYLRDEMTDTCNPVGNIVIDGAVYPNLKNWVFTQLSTIGTKVMAKQPLIAAEEAFLNVIPAPIYRAMITEISIDGTVAAAPLIASKYTDYVAILYAYYIMGDLYNLMDNTVAVADTVSRAKKGTDAGGGQRNCKIELAEPIMADIRQMKKDLVPFMQGVYEAYQTKLEELNNTIDFAQAIKERDDTFKQMLSERVGQAAMQHMLN